MSDKRIKLETQGAPAKVDSMANGFMLIVGGKSAAITNAEARRLANFIAVNAGPATRSRLGEDDL